MRLIFIFILLAAFLPLPAFAQSYSNREVNDRMERLERDLMVLQRQVARGNGTLSPAMGGDNLPIAEGGGAAQAEVRLSAMDEEVRSLRGRVEENEFQLHQLNENFTKLQKDLEFRLNELEQKANASPAPSPDAALPADGNAPEDLTPKDLGERSVPKGNPPASQTAIPDEPQEFDTPRDHYNYAFRLLNQTRYEDAANSFKSFTEKYPKDPLIGNAYYWLGETYYIRRDYVKAADQFRQGFEILPAGPKAADNLLKLAMSLNAMKNTKDACTVLGRVASKFKESSPSVAQKAVSEKARIGCK